MLFYSKKGKTSYEDVSFISCRGGWSRNTITQFDKRNSMRIKVMCLGKFSIHSFLKKKFVWRYCSVRGYGSYGNILLGSPAEERPNCLLSGFTTIFTPRPPSPPAVPDPRQWRSTVEMRIPTFSGRVREFWLQDLLWAWPELSELCWRLGFFQPDLPSFLFSFPSG